MSKSASHKPLLSAESSGLLLFALLLLGVVVAITGVDYFATHDGPQHLFSSYLINHYGDPATLYDNYLEPGAPLTGLGFSVIDSALELIVGWSAAYKLTIAFIAVVWAGGFAWMVHALRPQRLWLVLLGPASAVSWSLLMGLLSHTLSVGVCFFVVGLALRRAPLSLSSRVMVAVLLLVQTVVHPFGAMVSGLALLCMALTGKLGERRLREVALLAVSALPVLALVGWVASGASKHELETVWPSLFDRLALAPRFVNPGPWWRSAPLTLAGLGGTGWGLRQLLRREASAGDAAIAVASAALWIGGVAAPLSVPSWQFLSPRFLPFAALFGAALLPIERLRDRRAWAARAAIGGYATLAVVWAVWFSFDLRQRLADPLSGLADTTPRSGPRLSLVLDPYAGLAGGWGNDAAAWRGVDVPYFAPLHNIGKLYAVAQGGIPSHLFSRNPKVHNFVKSAEGLRRWPPEPMLPSLRERQVLTDPQKRRELLTWLAILGRPYEDVLLYGSADDAAFFEQRGYRARSKGQRLLIASFEGCALPLVIDGLAAEPAPLYLLRGFGSQQLRRVRIDTSKAKGGVLQMTAGGGLCGDGWLEIAEDSDRSGGPSAPDRHCARADERGRMVVVARASMKPLVCELALTK